MTVASAHSAVEVFAYALTALLSIRNPRIADVARPPDVRRISVPSTLKLLERPDGAPRAKVTRRFRLFVRSHEYRALSEARHVLIHRGMPFSAKYGPAGRTFYRVEAQLHTGQPWVLTPASALAVAEAVRIVMRDLVADTEELARGWIRPR